MSRFNRHTRITVSSFGKIIAKSGSTYTMSRSKVCKTFLEKINWARLVGNQESANNRINAVSNSILHGIHFEERALELYETRYNCPLITPERKDKMEGNVSGCADALTEDAVIEVKSPWNGSNHVRTLKGEVYNYDYYLQIQGYLWLYEKEHGVFVSYDPDLLPEYQLAVVQVPKDEEFMRRIEPILNQCIDYINEGQTRI